MRNGQAKLCALVSVLMVSAPVRAADRPQPARTNPLLFSHFRQQLLDANTHQDAYGRIYVEVDGYALDRQAYSLANDFYLRVDERLDALKQGFNQVQSARLGALNDPAKAGPVARAAWSESLKRLSNVARKLHGMLRLILGGVQAEDSSAPGIIAREFHPGFENETDAMGEQILRLDQRVKGFLSGRTFTVSVEELRGDDILILLSRIQAEALEMKEQLDARGPLSAQSSKQPGD
jgi:hypothetical protein